MSDDSKDAEIWALRNEVASLRGTIQGAISYLSELDNQDCISASRLKLHARLVSVPEYVGRLRSSLEVTHSSAEREGYRWVKVTEAERKPFVFEDDSLKTAERNPEREALAALYEWYDRDGSVGGASNVFEDHRHALSAHERNK